jgi:hypothetical protein
MSVPASAREQSTDEICRLVRAAAVQHRPITAFYDGRPSLSPLSWVTTGQANGECSVISMGEKLKMDRCRLAMRASGVVCP